MPLKAGSNHSPGEFADSMAAAMVDAFKNEWPYVMGDAPPPETLDQMKLLFAAVAQGVVNHLQQHPTDFEVAVADDGSGNFKGTVTKID